MKLFEDHCGTVVQKVDFGLGAALYKERFGDESFLEASICIYRLTPRGVFANFLTGANTKISTFIITLLSKLGLLQKVKTFWRGRLAVK
jgi:CelD/BcsL family acetyltransferase involved in cellulose biosynthesis